MRIQEGVTPLVRVCQDVEEECRTEGGALSKHMPMSWLWGQRLNLWVSPRRGEARVWAHGPLKAHYSFSL